MTTNVSIVGNVTRDPELRFTSNGTAVAEFSVAVNKRKRDGHGGYIDGDPEFYDITAWGDMADNCVASFGKGDRLVIVGRLTYSSWEKDGQKHSKVKVTADEIGPSLKWATAQIVRIEWQNSSDRSPVDGDARFETPRPAPSFADGEEPF